MEQLSIIITRIRNFFKYSVVDKIKHFFQRGFKGYCDLDVWNLYDWFETIIPKMLTELRDSAHGYPTESTPEEWNKILSDMIQCFKDSNEETCSVKNEYEEEYDKASSEFINKYGLLGHKLETEEEKESDKHTVHFMDELPEYKDIHDKWFNKEKELAEYRQKQLDKGLELFVKYFNDLWD